MGSEPFSWGNLIFVRSSDEKRREAYLNGARMNDFRCLQGLGEGMVKGFYGFQQNLAQGIGYLQQSAKQGYPQANYLLGCIVADDQYKSYELLGTDPIPYYQKAASAGHKMALQSLGAYAYDREEYKEALQLYMKAYNLEGDLIGKGLLEEQVGDCHKALENGTKA